MSSVAYLSIVFTKSLVLIKGPRASLWTNTKATDSESSRNVEVCQKIKSSIHVKDMFWYKCVKMVRQNYMDR